MRAPSSNKNRGADKAWRKITHGVALVVGGGLICAPCFADAGADATTAADSTNADASEGLAEIAITAEKYKSTIQDTPISISAVSGDQLINSGTTTIEDVT